MKGEQISQMQLKGNGSSITQKGKVDEYHFSPIDELNLIIKKQNLQDIQEINSILVQVLGYPSTEHAELHAHAMRLGNFDLEEKAQLKESKLRDTSTEKNLLKQETQYCNCCGFIKQEENISLITGLENIKNIGTSTYLFFDTLKNLIFLLFVLSFIYSGFAIATNIIASNNNNTAVAQEYKLDYLTISLSSKINNDTSDNRRFYFISAWLGVVTLICWFITLFVVKQIQQTEEHEYDKDNISCSDYSVTMEQMPMELTKDSLQKQLNAYYEILMKSGKVPEKLRQPLTIRKINIGKPFYLSQTELRDEKLEDLQQQIQKLRQQIIEMIKQRQQKDSFSVPKKQRQQKCKKLLQLNHKKAAMIVEKEKNIKQAIKNKKQQALTTVFVSFQKNVNRTLMLKMNNIYLLKRIKNLCSQTNQFVYEQGGNIYRPTMQKAPQPEDVIWQNLGMTDCGLLVRKIFTFTVTVILLGGSFGIVYGLTKAQDDNANDRAISIVISVVIAVVNAIIGVVLQQMTFLEKDYTATNIQASLAIKIIVAQMINTIFNPVIIAYYIKKSTGVYKVGGLVDNIFMTSISLSIVPPILVMLEPLHFIKALKKCLKRKASSKLYQSQKEHNLLHEGIEFQVGFNYITNVNLFMFACFYVSLQPIVSFVAIIGIFLCYWAQKYCLFYRYKRPIPGTDTVNDAIYQIIYLGPLIYSLGSLTWSNFDPQGIPPEAIIPNLIAVGISSFIILVPIGVILKECCRKEHIIQMTTYDENRIFFSTEYDRLNPTTSDAAIEDFHKYLEAKQHQMKNLSDDKKMQIFKKINFNSLKGQMNMNTQANPNLFAALMGHSSLNNGPQVMPPRPIMPNIFNQIPLIPQTNHMMMNQNIQRPMNNQNNNPYGMQMPQANMMSQAFNQGHQQRPQPGFQPGFQHGPQPGFQGNMGGGMGGGINYANFMSGMGRPW